MPALPVTDATWNDDVLRADRPVLVEITAAWCASADATTRAVDQLADDARGRLAVLRLDLDANPLIVRRYAITSIPTIFLVERGRVARRLVGGRSLRRLYQDVADYLDDVTPPPAGSGDTL